jgi:MFS family permease
VAGLSLVITAFYVTSAAGQPLMGRLADRFGPRRLFMLGEGRLVGRHQRPPRLLLGQPV